MVFSRIFHRSIRFMLLMLLFFGFFIAFPHALYSSSSQDQCISCHTSAKKLIEITRKIEASRPKVEKSIESEGEG